MVSSFPFWRWSGRTESNFGVRELAPAFSTAVSSAVGDSPRRVAARESGDESPPSKVRFAGYCASVKFTLISVSTSTGSPFSRVG